MNRPLFPWLCFALALLAAPLVFPQSAALSLLSQMGTMVLLCLSYNMLLGEGGMLSFGHAVYSGLGAFGAIHLMNRIGDGSLPFPITLVPLAGGLVGALCGVVFGYLTTRRAGTTFSMITLGLVELVSACALMFPDLFGGEGGISGNRVVGEPVMGISYGPQIQVYYLIAGWLLVCAVAIHALKHTPLGRILNAVRDNPERAAFIGYDPQRVRYLALILSAFFAGVSGGLSAINFEIVSAEYVGALRSGSILLFTFIGGAGFFYGPIIGGVVGVLFASLLSAYTQAWQFYLGAFFILIVMALPGGLAKLVDNFVRVMRARALDAALARLLAALALSGLLVLAGIVLATEMLYQLSLGSLANIGSDSGSGVAPVVLFGLRIDVHAVSAWLLAVVLVGVGIGAIAGLRRPWSASWSAAWKKVELSEQAQRREAA
ncbi:MULTISPECIES: branched-chain amino acid ABC transporter permease [unclassified Herbaspirillum]|uniref:branched-chain amino acid ABC transporter permease n=1 Tax=unclassified Herbaspirillum TaxID=2624150 RepID=UPI00114FEFFD|nr:MULTISPECIES: branched-chain amino acid ABC transporter permease [unclassified Herbaspirillum]MBB5393186.1 branched-chain amino acid transport system permease protein [Herbaspirillum sp. SJZ102]TQK04173.1 amino acid/amide ABC transporter membrane protein 2 (HAAT family) [Herbaspirillum sp. SJZ130]TQK10042.1 amino acid/amide ABC transporter membrane protein 2 (HAAT family) [Herbaspirillum sp. SJZ106]